MNAWLIVLFVMLWMCPAWAQYQNTPGKRYDIAALTSEFVKAVPGNLSCADTNGTITCLRPTGDFTAAEKAAMDAAVLAHDPDVRAKQQAAALASKTAMLVKLCQGANLLGQDLTNCEQELK